MIQWIKKHRLYAGLIGGFGVIILSLLGLQLFSPLANKPSTWVGLTKAPAEEVKISKITDFESCKAAGNAILESYPERCLADGQTFIRELSPDEIDKLKTPANQNENKKIEKITYSSQNFPNFKFSYNSDWKLDRNNLPFPSKDQPQKDEASKNMAIGLITLTKPNYEVELQLVPVWDFGGYGPSVNCTKNDQYNKIVTGRVARLQNYMLSEAEKQFGIKSPGLGQFKYSYVYIDDVEQNGEERFNSHFDGMDGPGSYPGKPADYFACYVQSRQTGAGMVTSEYKQNGKYVDAAILVKLKIQGENRSQEIFKEVDDMVLSAIGKTPV
jgi:hypothetical protein